MALGDLQLVAWKDWGSGCFFVEGGGGCASGDSGSGKRGGGGVPLFFEGV